MIIIVGAGLAGLTCAKILAQAGRPVMVLDAGDGPGGRVRSDRRDGFVLDRGFQVLFTAYPTVRRHLDLHALHLREFQPGAIIADGGKHYAMHDPFRDFNIRHLASTMTNPHIGLGDKVRVAGLRRDVMHRSVADIFQSSNFGDRSTYDELLARGFSMKGFIGQLIRPLYGGIFLNRDLHTSARMFFFTFKMLSTGSIAVPSLGMQEIANQLASALPDGSLRLNTSVREVIVRESKAAGVCLEDGSEIEGDAVVLAVDAPAVQRFAGITIPASIVPVASTVVYFASSQSLYEDPMIILNAAATPTVNSVVQMDNIAPGYAPSGQHLISVAVLGNPSVDDATLYARCRSEIVQMFPDIKEEMLTPLAIYRIPMAQFDQPPGIYPQLPTNTTNISGLFLAGEYTESSSIHGAMHSGEKVATMLMEP
jgi:phytoene dehydrogenase-like protein